MRRIPQLVACAALLLPFLGLGACGSGGVTLGSLEVDPGPAVLALPAFDDGSSKTLVLRNVSGATASVDVTTAFLTPLAGSPFAVPPFAEVRVPAPVADTFLRVETTGATTGLVEPYLLTERSGPDEEAVGGAVLATTQSAIPIHTLTDKVLFLNDSQFGGFPTAATFLFTFHATDGTATLLTGAPLMVGTQVTIVVPVPLGSVGHLSVVPEPFPTQVAPVGTEFFFTLATHDDNDIVLDVDDQRRLLDESAFSDLVLDFGQDAQGNYHDFDVVASNVSDAPASFTITSIRDAGGQLILAQPRVVTLEARDSRLYASNLADSIGLVNPEVHPFADLFGDVFGTAGLTRFRMTLNIDPGIFLTARQFDPLALDFAMRVRPITRRTVFSALVSETQTVLDAGIRNYVRLVNPGAGPMTVGVRAYTQVKGTEYILDNIVVPAHSMLDVRPDALGLREDVGDVFGPEVRNHRIVFISNVPFLARAWQETRNGVDLIVMVRPHVIRLDD